MAVKKPLGVATDPFKSAKWDEITQGRTFRQSDAPVLELLVQWYAVVRRCIEDMDAAGGQVAYTNDMGDLRALPQISTMKQASAEIRALNKQLGIDDEARSEEALVGTGTLRLVQGRRAERRTKAAS